MSYPHTLANGPGNVPDATQLMDNFNAAVQKAGDTMTGDLAFSPTTKGVVGTTTNDNAAAGNVGQYLVATGTNVSAPTSSQWGDLCSITFPTGGDWDVTGVFYVQLNGASCTAINLGLGTASGNNATGVAAGDTNIAILPPTTQDNGTSIPNVRYPVAGGITVYAKIYATYTGGPPKFYGRISARRMR